MEEGFGLVVTRSEGAKEENIEQETEIEREREEGQKCNFPVSGTLGSSLQL